MESAYSSLNIHFNPLLPEIWLYVAIGLAFIPLLLALWKNKNGVFGRVAVVGAFILILLNPSLLEEKRQSVPDVAALVIDNSASMNIQDRAEMRERAETYIKQALERKENIELRIVETPPGDALESETRLFAHIDKAMADVPKQRRAGVIIISDGQIHDVPSLKETQGSYGPVHLLVTGHEDEKDRQLVITQAPSYGIVGQNVTLEYKVLDTASIDRGSALVKIRKGDEAPQIYSVVPGELQSVTLPINHAGQNVFQIEVDGVADELTLANNKAALIVNGVRDRLRVLLVSGKPHAGGRTWRDLLTSDPGVDLIHFTILREPNKLDATPQRELSLIAFPFRELFEVKLYEFDLIIFDRYRLNRILPDYYFNNIARYVEEGGALLEASGPGFATEDSIYYTSLMKVLPALPTGDVIREEFYPQVTEAGQQHPVTRNLVQTSVVSSQNDHPWAPWLRQVVIDAQEGDVLMSGAEKNPLLVLNRVGDGRVAQLASDHIWLWSRHYKGGGPHAELLRRIVHWLMKEPELDEKALDVEVRGNELFIRSRNYKYDEMLVRMTKPDGDEEEILLTKNENGYLERAVAAEQLGIYALEDVEGQSRFVVVGDLNPKELRGVVASEDVAGPVLQASGGGAIWLENTSEPSVRILPAERNYSGSGWIGLRENSDYIVTGVQDRTLLIPWITLILLLGIVIGTWWKEGRLR